MVLDGVHAVLDLRDMLVFVRSVEYDPLFRQTRTEGFKFVVHLGDGEVEPLELVPRLDPDEGYLLWCWTCG